MVKKFLDERSVAYSLRNVAADEDAAREFFALGGKLPPLILINGTVIHGFDPDAIDAALDRATGRPSDRR